MPPQILYVEDNPGEVFLLMDAVQKVDAHLTVLALADGEQALQFLGSAPTHPCVIVLDLGLPKVDGAEVFRSLKANAALASIPVVIFAENRARQILTAAGPGPDLFLSKPMSLEGYNTIARQIVAFCAPPTRTLRAAG